MEDLSARKTPLAKRRSKSDEAAAWSAAYRISGGHEIRTRNPLRGTTIPAWPLTIRIPSGRSSLTLPCGWRVVQPTLVVKSV